MVIRILKKLPILRHLIALVMGIFVEYHYQIGWKPLAVTAFISVVFAIVSGFLPIDFRFRFQRFTGVSITIMLMAMGALLAYTKDGRHDADFLGNVYQQNLPVIFTIEQDPTPKEKTYKALAKAEWVFSNHHWQKAKGGAYLYFKKEDSLISTLGYGKQIIVFAQLLPIKSTGNPGCFNYQQYAAFQNIYYQCFLKPTDYLSLATTKSNWLDQTINHIRNKVLATLRKYIIHKNELALAEALLIGYRDDLDRDLVQAYSNTGVVHVIAISGLHLGMIYGLMVGIFSFFKKHKATRIAKPIAIILVLWGFSFLAGAAPSILRSAIMFSFIALSETIERRTSIYNNLTLSAFIILLINPYSLWDVGFQLSYAAVLSIVLFSRFIKNWLYFDNKLLCNVWDLMAVTIAAQLLTLPVVLFHFHQLPTMFLITNILIVPLSGIIIYFELGLIVLAFIPPLAKVIGYCTEGLIAMMNSYIIHVNKLPFAVYDNILISQLQALLLFIIIVGFAIWLIFLHKPAFFVALASCLLFIVVRTQDCIVKANQQKLIVYNVSKHQAIDIVQGKHFFFLGDDALKQDGYLKNFNLKPARIINRATEIPTTNSNAELSHIIQSSRKTIVVINQPIPTNYQPKQKIKADAIVISHNPRLSLTQLHSIFDCNQYIIDASNSFYRTTKWMQEAINNQLRIYSVAEKGAYEIDM